MSFKGAVSEAVNYLKSVGVNCEVEYCESKSPHFESFDFAIITPEGVPKHKGRSFCWYVSDNEKHYKKLISRVKKKFPQKSPS